MLKITKNSYKIKYKNLKDIAIPFQMLLKDSSHEEVMKERTVVVETRRSMMFAVIDGLSGIF